MRSLRITRLSKLATATIIAIGASTSASAADDLNVRFSWKLKGEYGFFYYGQEQDVYKDRSLNVSFGEGAGAPAALGALLQGQEDVVILPGIFAVSAIQQGMPVKLVALYQPAAPVVLISHEDNPVLAPGDLEGKSVAHSIGETGSSYLGVFCAVNNIDCSTINLVQMNADSRVPQFVQGQVDVVSVYKTNDLPLLEERLGTTFPVLDYSEFGLEVPGLAAVVSNDALENNADALRRFLEGTSEAIQLTANDPEAATAALAKVWSGAPSASVIQRQIEATAESIVHIDGRPYGWIPETAILNALELVSSTEDVGEFRPTDEFYSNELLGE